MARPSLVGDNPSLGLNWPELYTHRKYKTNQINGGKLPGKQHRDLEHRLRQSLHLEYVCYTICSDICSKRFTGR